MRFLTFSILFFSVFGFLQSSTQAETIKDHTSIILMEEDPYLPFAEVMPEPVGGMEIIYKKLEYPEIAKRMGKQGKVYLLVYVNESGVVDDVKVIKGIGGGCDEAAVKAIKELKFSPAKNGGVAVKVKLSLSIVFKLS